MVKELDIEAFLQLNQGYVLLDTRTPAEYEKAHVPGAKNLPLLDNEERAIIGTTYKQKGREEAILQGFELTGSKWRNFIEKALELAPDKKIAVYCWRGGMRSGIMSWILDLYGFKTIKITGGYKSYRNWVLQQFEKEYPIIVLGGMTGSHKTEILTELKKQGEQTIDLEELAQHLGSSYGTLNKLVQPSQEQFENLLAKELFQLDLNRHIWMEDESRNIGKRTLPEHIFEQIRAHQLILLDIEKEKRIDFLVEEYGSLDKEFLIEATERISKRLGPQHAKNAIEAIKNNDMRQFIETVLTYYDKTYTRGLSKRNSEMIKKVTICFENPHQCAEEILLKIK
ncbi:MAG: tRNA 2-selenouridine(34) synthase MnmH [Brumimicrobium sp.]|nr:tRNA 2-selenouridine(34) synthase MnmH [Brumimicrobium sp.]